MITDERTHLYICELEERNAKLVEALKEISELDNVRADEAAHIAYTALKLFNPID